MLVRLAALDEVDLLDESSFGYHGDVGLSWRMRLAGWRLAYDCATHCASESACRRCGVSASVPGTATRGPASSGP
ncbi:MAG: hypothetical protein WDA16_12085 [Candidatus Thermoplasmatota archaeon]